MSTLPLSILSELINSAFLTHSFNIHIRRYQKTLKTRGVLNSNFELRIQKEDSQFVIF